MRRLLVRAAERRPQIVVIEDLHWIDSATEQFLVQLVDSVPALRPARRLHIPSGLLSPFGERSTHAHRARAAVGGRQRADGGGRARARCAAGRAPPALDQPRKPRAIRSTSKRWCVTAGGGASAWTEGRFDAGDARRRGRDPRHDPRRHHGAHRSSRGGAEAHAAARLRDRPRVHAAARGAAWRGCASAATRCCASSRALELIYEKTRVPELAYMFKHALTQDVAYHSLLVQRRRELHA